MMCDGATYEEVLEDLDRRVLHHGWAVQGVEGRRPWAYTIGLAERYDHAELVITGVDPHLSVHVLNALGTMVAAGEELVPGQDHVVVCENELAFGEIHPVHLDNGLVAMWPSLYLDHRHVEPPPLRVVQALPLPGRRLPLDVPHTTLG